MNQSPLVGRSDKLDKLLTILIQAWNYHGNVVFIEGIAGIGKTTLLKMLQEKVTHFPELEKAAFIYGSCYESTGTHNAYQPFVDILEALAQTDAKRRDVTRLTLNIF